MAKRTVYIPYAPPKKEHASGDSCEECGHEPTSEKQMKFLEKLIAHYQQTAPEEYKKDTEEFFG